MDDEEEHPCYAAVRDWEMEMSAYHSSLKKMNKKDFAAEFFEALDYDLPKTTGRWNTSKTPFVDQLMVAYTERFPPPQGYMARGDHDGEPCATNPFPEGEG